MATNAIGNKIKIPIFQSSLVKKLFTKFNLKVYIHNFSYSITL